MRKTTKDIYVRIPLVPLTNTDITYYAKRLRIPRFRGVYMLDGLPKTIRSSECGVINLDNNRGSGTHWVCYKKRDNHVYYYDSYGNLRPPLELMRYFKSDGGDVNVHYNYERHQSYDSVICGHLCLRFLCIPIS